MINMSKAGIAPLAIAVIIGVVAGGAVTIPVAVDITIGDSISPSNPLYVLERIGENLRLVMTPSEIEKATLRLQMATERLQEIKAEIGAGNYEHIEGLSNDYGTIISEIAEGLVNEEGELIDGNLAELVNEATSIHKEVLESIIVQIESEDMPEEAQEALKGLNQAKEASEQAKRALENIPGGR